MTSYMKRKTPVKNLKMNGKESKTLLVNGCLYENYKWADQNGRVTKKRIVTIQVVKIAKILRLSGTTTILHLQVPVLGSSTLPGLVLTGADFSWKSQLLRYTVI